MDERPDAEGADGPTGAMDSGLEDTADAATSDAAFGDGGSDASALWDAATADSALSDASVDASLADAGTPDASLVDVSTPDGDAFVEDASSPPDANVWLDASAIDAAGDWPADAGPCTIPASAWTTPPQDVAGPPETPPTATTITSVPLVASTIAYDATSGLIYATTPASDGATGNSLVTIDPWTGVKGAPVSIGSGPNAVTVSDDGAYVYVGLTGAQDVQRYDAIGGTLDLLFPFAPAQPSGPVEIASLFPLVSSAHSVIAEVGQYSDGWTYQNVVVFDDSVVRTNQVTYFTGGFPDILGGPLIPSGADGLWFAPQGVVSPAMMQYLCVNEAGVFLANSLPFTGGYQMTPATFGSGELTSVSGAVTDAKSMVQLGTYGVSTYNQYPMQVLDDGFGRVTFFIGVYDDVGHFENDSILTYDQSSRGLVSRIDFTASSDEWPAALVRFGEYGVAVLYYGNSDGAIDLIRSPLLKKHP